jgi:7,8-dihydropterin-6-yl-methyl-4-(beta-D-ribofuranosyl)aminobenzene 5'-phosphate synthase
MKIAKTSIFLVIFLVSLFLIQTFMEEEVIEGISGLEPCKGKLTILYNDFIFDTRCRSELGLSCLIETNEKVVLFDTGGIPEILNHNIEVLGVNIQDIDCVVISHEHWDHIGGLKTILSQKPSILVYVPGDCPYHIISTINTNGGVCVELGNATRLSKSIAISDTLYGTYPEQALIVKTNDGIILVTGCSHAGVQNVARSAFESSGENINFIIGGFHTVSSRKRACDELDELGVIKISPIHGTDKISIEYFRERYGENYVQSGVGFNLEF